MPDTELDQHTHTSLNPLTHSVPHPTRCRSRNATHARAAVADRCTGDDLPNRRFSIMQSLSLRSIGAPSQPGRCKLNAAFRSSAAAARRPPVIGRRLLLGCSVLSARPLHATASIPAIAAPSLPALHFLPCSRLRQYTALLCSTPPQRTFSFRAPPTVARTSLLRRSLSSLSSSSSSSAGWSSFPSSSSSSSSRPYVVYVLLAANVLVFVLWRHSEGRPSEQRWMIAHFTVSLRSLSAGRLHTLVTSAFSQQDVMHLLFNCLALHVFGSALCVYLGSARFLLVYFGGALTSSVAHVAYQNYLYPRLLRANQSEQRRLHPYSHYSIAAAQRPYAFDRPAMGAR